MKLTPSSIARRTVAIDRSSLDPAQREPPPNDQQPSPIAEKWTPGIAETVLNFIQAVSLACAQVSTRRTPGAAVLSRRPRIADSFGRQSVVEVVAASERTIKLGTSFPKRASAVGETVAFRLCPVTDASLSFLMPGDRKVSADFVEKPLNNTPNSSSARSPPSERNSTTNIRLRSSPWQGQPNPAIRTAQLSSRKSLRRRRNRPAARAGAPPGCARWRWSAFRSNTNRKKTQSDRL